MTTSIAGDPRLWAASSKARRSGQSFNARPNTIPIPTILPVNIRLVLVATRAEPEWRAVRISGEAISPDKGVSMCFIPTKFHAPLDYIVGAALIAAPWIFQFSEHTAATVVPIVLGIGLIAYSLFTNYELGAWKVFPMAMHNVIDVVAGAVLAAWPWIFGFADQTANVWVPH